MTDAPLDMDELRGLSVRDVIDRRADAHPDRTFLIEPESGRRVGYGEARAAARGLAARLAERGLRPGDGVAYAAPNSVEAALAVLGLLYGGHLAIAINLVAGRDTIAYVLEHSQAKLILGRGRGLDVVAEAAEGQAFPPVLEIDSALLEPAKDLPDPSAHRRPRMTGF